MGQPGQLHTAKDMSRRRASENGRAQVHVGEHSIWRDEDHHLFVIDQRCIACTPTQYRVLMLLLEHAFQCVPYARLLAQARDQPLTASAAGMPPKQARLQIMHLISDLRARLWVGGLDIVAVMGTGYMLVDVQLA